jgi:trk system potassium uptake protein TrkH
MLGTILLMMPFATVAGSGLNFLDALFTATSAVCVTGLVVVDTGTYFTVFGKSVIMGLIQIGGLGFMTFGTIVAMLMGKKIYLRERLILKESLNQNSVQGIVLMVKRVLILTFIVELAGAIILACRFMQHMTVKRALFYGVFHSISAFNNAGFDLIGNFRSFTPYVSDGIINITLALLIIIGGLGFAVSLDCIKKRKYNGFSLHTKVVLITTFSLLCIAFFVIFAFEFFNTDTLGKLNLKDKALAAFFQGVSVRTAGFNTIDISLLKEGTLFVMIMLMFIGASPGSTGGGIKTSTFSTLLLYVKSIIMGEEDINLFGKQIAKIAVRKATAIFFISLTIVIISTLLICWFTDVGFLPSLFEATSAFGTVGLSVGVTSQLNFSGKIVIIITMFLGRLGPLTIAMALTNRPKTNIIRYPEEKIIVG